MPPKSFRALTERQRCVLQALVRLYIQRGRPVGSRVLARHLRRRLNLSPASIRTVMAELEEMHYLTHPHTSAGRVPTDKGYRAYVDSLTETETLSEHEQNIIARELQARENRDTLLQDASRVLSTLASAIGIIRLPAPEQLIIHRIEFIQVSSTHLLLVLVLQSDVVRTFVVQSPLTISPTHIERLSQLLNEYLAGHSLSAIPDILSAVLHDVPPLPAPLPDLVQQSLQQFPLLLQPSWQLYVSGASQLLRYPECATVEHARTIATWMEESSMLLHLLTRYEQQLQHQPIFIGIGRELRAATLQDYTLILARYHLGSAQGIVGIIGPKRMFYPKVIPIVRSVAQRLSELCLQA
ncbi:MAG: heat-inducible transcriptional repressor HrcA [Candidatus Kapabacteria bacterium]|nr:heat-inducible transcriptional repressor HrcA [Candidatus Kapabacteria bacterium]MDW8225206.1 heat-inducible transcriptional repressor HrcA [Bacteroidota bacterium]